MRTPTDKNTDSGTERRSAERRDTPEQERRLEPARAATGERRVVDQRGMTEAMVDALSDILEWERRSERALRVASETTTSDLTKN